jgi:hypothetical protein
MKLLNHETKLFYFKSINLLEKSNTLFLIFNQEHKYIISAHDNCAQDYINIGLLLVFKNKELAENHYYKLKEFLLEDTISIDKIGENEFMFIGSHDYTIKADSYNEFEMEQTKEEWLDRYLYACKQYSELIIESDFNRKMVEKIRSLISIYSNDNISNSSNLILQELIQIVESQELIINSRSTSNALLAVMNNKLIDIEKKLDSLNKK